MTKSMTKESIESPWRFRHFASTEQQTHSFYIGILPFKNREEPHCRLQCKGWTDSDTDAELKLIVNPFYHSYVLKKFFGISALWERFNGRCNQIFQIHLWGTKWTVVNHSWSSISDKEIENMESESELINRIFGSIKKMKYL